LQVLLMREPWFKATIWIDLVYFAPFYLFAIYAFVKGLEWIRVPAILYGAALLTIIIVIMGEEFFGVYATKTPLAILAAYGLWGLHPVLVLVRMYIGGDHPFTRRRAIA
jgi:hypothetical protein